MLECPRVISESVLEQIREGSWQEAKDLLRSKAGIIVHNFNVEEAKISSDEEEEDCVAEGTPSATNKILLKG